MNLNQWAIKWGVPFEAVQDLRREFGTIDAEFPPAPDPGGASEGAVQNRVRLEASRKGLRLWRNNRGAFTDESGRLVRYGLANDSKAMDKKIKSADLIGIRPVVIRRDHVGATLGLFVAREVKPMDWRYTGTARERAQLNFLELVVSMGGDAAFANNEGTL